jgi:hypothetical protein
MALSTVDSIAVTTDSSTATTDGFQGPIGAQLSAAVQALSSLAGSLRVGAGFAGGMDAIASLSGALTNYASVTLTSPLYTGIGGVLDPNFWAPGVIPPTVGSVLFYDPTFITIEPNGEINSTSNNCQALVLFESPTGLTLGLIFLTPGFVSYASAISSVSGAITLAAAVLAGSGTAIASIGGNLTTAIQFAGTAQAIAAALGQLSTQIELSAQIQARGSLSGRLPSLAALQGAAQAVATLAATLHAQTLFAASVAGVGGISGSLTLTKPLQSALIAVGQLTGMLSTSPGHPLSVSIGGIATISGALSTESTLSASCTAIATAFGALSTQILLSASISAVASGSGTLTDSGSPIGLYTEDPEFVIPEPRVFRTPRFRPLGPTERRVLTFDFADELDDGEFLDGTITIAVTCTLGVDPDPADILNGIPAYNVMLTQVQQPVSAVNGVIGNDYYFVVTANTSNPQKVLARYALLPIRS